MKVRDSGMPEEEIWSEFFDPDKILRTFGLDQGVKDLVEFGCGYGTFTLAAAKLATGTVHALDIEPEMVETVREKCRQAGVDNVRAVVATSWLVGPASNPIPLMRHSCSISSTMKNRQL